jgi:hypothetical protein
MSQYDEFDDETSENENGQNDPAGLRKLIKDLQKKLDAASKERDEAVKAVSDFRVRDVLNERGLSDKRALRLLKADGVDAADAGAVDAWLQENGDLFGYKPPVQDQEETREAYQQMADSEAKGTPLTSEGEAKSRIGAVESEKELTDLLAKMSKR